MATTKTIQSVERAFSILEYLQQCGGGERSVKEIADALELNKYRLRSHQHPDHAGLPAAERR